MTWVEWVIYTYSSHLQWLTWQFEGVEHYYEDIWNVRWKIVKHRLTLIRGGTRSLLFFFNTIFVSCSCSRIRRGPAGCCYIGAWLGYRSYHSVTARAPFDRSPMPRLKHVRSLLAHVLPLKGPISPQIGWPLKGSIRDWLALGLMKPYLITHTTGKLDRYSAFPTTKNPHVGTINIRILIISIVI